jgi:hypothetical protein
LRGFERERLAELLARVGARATNDAWRGVYDRWRRNEPISNFQRRMLGLWLIRQRNGRPLTSDDLFLPVLPKRTNTP